ncbi:unnamed protein product, partial [Owenia fusiformis]
HKEIQVDNFGPLNVYIQGNKEKAEIVVLTVHDIGCNYMMYNDFVDHPAMSKITSRTCWVHVCVPGQEENAQDLPANYVFPTMQQMGQSLINVIDQLSIKEVVCFGEGAGANILARFAMAHPNRVLGIVLIHCTGTTAGFLSSIKDKVIQLRLEHSGMNPSAETYLVLHRFGSIEGTSNKEDLQSIIDKFQASLKGLNVKNLRKFVDAFMKRTNIMDSLEKLQNNILIVTGSQAKQNKSVYNFHQSLLKVCKDKTKVEFLQVENCANVLEERPQKLCESFLYFLQGCGKMGAVPMVNVDSKRIRQRSISMEDADRPLMSYGGSPLARSPLSNSPPTMNMSISPP